MSYCPNCGKKLSPGSIYCSECGVHIFDITSEDDFSDTNNLGDTGRKRCPNCGELMPNDMFYCLNCGFQFNDMRTTESHSAEDLQREVHRLQMMEGTWKNKWISLFLCIFFGWLGIHKFYEGKPFIGLIYLFTLGGFGVGWVVDIVRLSLKPNPYQVK